MKIEQIYTGCLAQGAYFIESEGEAAVIDPLREVQPYLDKAQREGATIKYVFETHFHADFVSGHLDLSEKTGAPIVYGPNANPNFAAHIAADGEEFKLGKITIKALHTPGHTMESTCYLLLDENGKETALFSGDTLFIGDVGRPDLAQKSDLTTEDLAGHLFDSLRNKVMPLPNDLIVYPAHGAGSACGKNMSKETSDTLGNQKMFNYALRADMTKEEFVKEVTDGLDEPPQYFPQNVQMNKEGYESIDDVLARGAQALSPAAFEVAANETGALILDTRAAADFAEGFIPNSINIGIDGSFAPWVGALIPDLKQTLLLVTEPGREEEVVTRLARVGYDHTLGYLKGGFAAWQDAGSETDTVQSVAADDFAEKFKSDDLTIIDVRKPTEFDEGHVEGAKNLPLDHISDLMAEFPKNEPMYLHCAGGYRSMIASSILKARGFDNVVNIEGGYGAMTKAGVAVSGQESAASN
ncbi:MBL fold metallo-hydrolase [Persicitalea jodogahamensis]|uniref:MBL fold metallo-hydrolase n=1 Tax=Persicitalea jodogahamensis TaxID=402147 RepID=A0A8J3D8I2_9BACT|nr:MBL fold metallo-hydrolase [Persicitalea jodogahamensis]GHB68588.1 MBL fold metallo-hydrolase [Persicitalea jodogahamensis]